jgi:predicted metal-dependent enzyme (double-stranded beta helix superfamily)
MNSNSAVQKIVSLSESDPMKTMGFVSHPLGYYWKELTPIDSPVEVVLIVWSPGSKSLPHDHGRSWNVSWVVPLSDRTSLNGIFYRCWGDLLRSQETEILTGGGLHVVKPHEIHEIVNDSDEIAVSLHCYFPRRDKA